MLGYTTRSIVEAVLQKSYPSIEDDIFNIFIESAEEEVNRILGYENRLSVSGILLETITNEKAQGKLDSFDNIVIDLGKPPIKFNEDGSPAITAFSLIVGGITVDTLPLTSNGESLFDVPSSRGFQLVYPSLYLTPAVTGITPTQRLSLQSFRSFNFFTKISYVGGYAIVPKPIQIATSLLAGDLINNDPSNLQSYVQGSMEESYSERKNGMSENALRAEKLLQPYKKVSW